MSAYYSSILQGAVLTIAVSLAALAVSVVLGLLGAAAKLSGRAPLVALAENRDWTGKPIARKTFNESLPGFKNAKDTASTEISKAIARTPVVMMLLLKGLGLTRK